jgi:hypothetical protein
MIEFITGLLDAQIDYVGLLTAVIAYIAFMWIAFTIWVFVDARKKFKSIWKALLLTLFVFPLNIPGFILYLIFRPEHDDFADVSVVDSAGQQHHYGGVQVPLVHFTGEKGEVQMTFGLTLNPKTITPNSPDMNIDVSWESDNEHLSLKANPRNVEVVESKPNVESEKMAVANNRFSGIGDRIKGSLSSVAATVSGSLSKSSDELSEKAEDSDGLITAERADSDNRSHDNSFSSKKKKKRR